MPLIIRPILASFARAHPDIKLEITASEELIDVVSLGFWKALDEVSPTTRRAMAEPG